MHQWLNLSSDAILLLMEDKAWNAYVLRRHSFSCHCVPCVRFCGRYRLCRRSGRSRSMPYACLWPAI